MGQQQGFVSFRDLDHATAQQQEQDQKAAGGYWEDKGWAGKEWHPPVGDGSDATRPDASILGMPPELALLSPLGIGRAIAGATGMAGRAVAGAKATVGAAVPMVKYEGARSLLQAFGVPGPLATVLATAASGGAKPQTTRAGRAAARRASTSAKTPSASAAPVAAPPAAQTPAAATSAPASGGSPSAGPQWSPQRIANETGLAARRQKVSLSKEQYAEAEALVKSGTAPAEAVQSVAAKAGQLTAEETRLYAQLREAGKSHEEATRGIEAMRTITTRHGTPDTERVLREVVERNVSGRWKPETPR